MANALRRAKDSGVPKDNIENALKKVCSNEFSETEGHTYVRVRQAAGGNDKGNTHLIFEVMGPGSVGIIV